MSVDTTIQSTCDWWVKLTLSGKKWQPEMTRQAQVWSGTWRLLPPSQIKCNLRIKKTSHFNRTIAHTATCCHPSLAVWHLCIGEKTPPSDASTALVPLCPWGHLEKKNRSSRSFPTSTRSCFLPPPPAVPVCRGNFVISSSHYFDVQILKVHFIWDRGSIPITMPIHDGGALLQITNLISRVWLTSQNAHASCHMLQMNDE
jgi:hypothetical protein